MRYILLAFSVTSSVAMAAQMESFGANYYQDDSSIINYDTNKNLVPDVIVGDHAYSMEFSSLTDIAKTAGVIVNHDDQTSWLCLTSKGINYWFISDNEMGQGDLTSIAIARTAQPKSCSSYNGDLSVTVKKIPLLNASLETLSSLFSHKPNGNTVQYCNNTKNYGNFTQMNCLQYFFKKNNVKGVIINQITSN
ncbi:hypothetical protein [Pantoea sp. C2G6]|uniref:hypothetical protein n=1 Tax=Pantoea sp. C2G6 TaxID=3243084 RepID=UPI003ED9430E